MQTGDGSSIRRSGIQLSLSRQQIHAVEIGQRRPIQSSPNSVIARITHPRNHSSDVSAGESSDESAGAAFRPVLRRVARGAFALAAGAERAESWDSSESACSRASLAASFSSLFLLRSLATVRSSFVTSTSSSALFIFGARGASLAVRLVAAGLAVRPDRAAGGLLALGDPRGRPGLRFGASSPAVARELRVEAFFVVARAMIVSCCSNVWAG